jgi:hypothetical protein
MLPSGVQGHIILKLNKRAPATKRHIFPSQPFLQRFIPPARPFQLRPTSLVQPYNSTNCNGSKLDVASSRHSASLWPLGYRPNQSAFRDANIFSVLILSAVAVNKFGGAFSALNFLLFCVPSLIYGVAHCSGAFLAPFPRVFVVGTKLFRRVPSYLHHLYAIPVFIWHTNKTVALEFLNMIFFFSGYDRPTHDPNSLDLLPLPPLSALSLAMWISLAISQQRAKLRKLRLHLAHSLGITILPHLTNRLLWLITLVLVARQGYLERQGNVPRNAGIKDEPVQVTLNQAAV